MLDRCDRSGPFSFLACEYPFVDAKDWDDRVIPRNG